VNGGYWTRLFAESARQKYSCWQSWWWWILHVNIMCALMISVTVCQTDQPIVRCGNKCNRVLKPFNGFGCHLASTFGIYTYEVQWHTVLDDTLTSRVRRYLGHGTPGQNMQSTCTCKLQPNRQSYAATWRIQTRRGGLATAIPPFAKLLWSLFSDILVNKTKTNQIS